MTSHTNFYDVIEIELEKVDLLNEFKRFVVEKRRLTDPKEILVEVLLGLSSEVGEIQDLYKKQLRDRAFDPAFFKKLVKDEMSDLLHYIFSLLVIEDLDIYDIINHNIEKINKRYANKKIC